MSDLLVKYKNDLNTISMRKFNSKEMDLFFSICARMRDKSISTVKFDFEDLRKLSDYKMTATKAFVKDLEGVYDKMLQLTYRQVNSEGTISKFVLFTSFEINPTQQYVEVTVNPKLEYILNQLSHEFTQFELQEFTGLSSGYAKTMYRLLKQFKATGYYIVTVKEFRELLDIPSSYRMGNIDQQVLKPIKKELSQYFDPFEIKKIKAKKGNRIDRLEFTFREKKHDDELPTVSLANWLE